MAVNDIGCLFGLHRPKPDVPTRCKCGAFKYPGTGWFYLTWSEWRWKWRKAFRRG